MTYEIIKVMNNNVILVRVEKSSEECMLIGKGLGFGRRTGEVITTEEDKIEKKYYATDESGKTSYIELLKHVDRAVIGVGEEFIAEAESVLGKLSEQVHVVLIDHIAFAINRVREDMVIDNPFLFEIRTLYPKEYELGLKAVERINSEFMIYLPPDEAGFIALHLYAARKNSAVKDAVKQTRIMTEVMQYIEKIMKKDLKADEYAYIRLLNHMRGAIDRYQKGIETVNPLLKSIKSEMPISYKLAKQVGQFLRQEFSWDFGEHELGYLTIHIERIRSIKE
ncbi:MULTISPECIES: PRD domain-containing protein [unclassified Fusibacter]|uniref:PRD domain-containing protein n=1 Tax=unclassified Fusibacter TaxID=2624464 RepID=UPI001012FDD1|nr:MULTISPECIES: PRD domain-containing protein [unclassified Fusibacter]MCK8061330.1 PRD domain-containing protein [Fusibacter sp. A2]NPE23473.1 PRD domain-containing protein [Fusibacter sp. A1]RXV59079.1 PRD domain-containing protein [Fusibacter sp. A1]